MPTAIRFRRVNRRKGGRLARLARLRKVARGRRIRSRVHNFKRTVYLNGAISGSTLLDTFGRSGFSLANVTNYTEFTNLFDMYKINGIKIRFMPRANSAEAGTNQGLVKFFSVVDYDDVSLPTAITDLLQYENVKITNTSRDHMRYFKPKVASAVYQNAVGTGYAPRSGWIDCSSPTVEHYGIKWALQQLPAGNQSMDIAITYYMAFKHVV